MDNEFDNNSSLSTQRQWVSERVAISYKLDLADKGLSFEVLDNGFQDLI